MRGAFAMACGAARDWRAGETGSGARSGAMSGPAAASRLPALCAHLAGAPDARLAPVAAPCLDGEPAPAARDLANVIGQRGARRALEVAAAGGHHMLTL